MESTTPTLAKKTNHIATSGSIRTIQQMWDATIDYHTKEEFDTTAMYNVYQRMDPRLNFQDIANVFSAVYADTYWNVNFMDYGILAKSLQSALSLEQSRAVTYAKNAVSQWRGIFCRKNDADTGRIPTPGDCYNSIDIVCNNDTAIPPQALIQNWNSRYWNQPKVGKNYVYVRCQNLSFYGDLSLPTAPVVNMFFTSGGINQPPSSWQQLFTAFDPTKTGGEIVLSDGEPGAMPQGTRGASEAFMFEPKSNDHVCLVAIVATNYFANPQNISQGNWNSAQWITSNGAAAWHNVNPQQLKEEKLAIYNQDGTSEDFSFVVNCSNVPVGSKLTLKIADTALKTSSGTIAITNPSQSFEMPVTLPAFYEGQLLVNMVSPNGGLLPANAAVSIQMLWRLKKGHKQYASVANYQGSVLSFHNAEDLDVNLGNFTFIGSGI